MSEYILENPDVVRNKVVADIGSGSGVVAIACALAGAEKIYAIDIDPRAENIVKSNAAFNNVANKIHPIIACVDDKLVLPKDVSMITSSDILYDPETEAGIRKWLLEQIISRNLQALIASFDMELFDFQALGQCVSQGRPSIQPEIYVRMALIR